MTPVEAAYLLSLSVGAEPEQIEKARRREARLWHPDRQSDPEVAQFANDRMAAINQAADLLLNTRRSDATGRASHDGGEQDEPARPRPVASPDLSTLLSSGRCGGIAFALCVVLLAPFLSLSATYGLALVLGVGVALVVFFRPSRSQ